MLVTLSWFEAESWSMHQALAYAVAKRDLLFSFAGGRSRPSFEESGNI
jgi:hypothetical protein